ncbi:MAG: class I SAM-dependent methyltransferase [Armatimonadota bacterium]|jgi:ubiquinone/menaquinone biosynthesis C-methylase UbiE
MKDDDVSRMWDRNAETWAHDVRKGYDTYRDLFNNPAFFEFAGDLRGLTVLDVGCGEGYNTRLSAKRGARMTGTDISKEMIRLAWEAEEEQPLGIRYEVAPAADVAMFEDGSFDAVVSTMALMDCADYEGAIEEIARLLKAGGLLAFSINHPCFTNALLSHDRDEQGRPVAVRTGDYFDAGPVIDEWGFARAPEDEHENPFRVPRFPRLLSQYLNALPKNGFVIEGVHEPRPTEEACREDERLWKWRLAPIFLYVKARRVSPPG